MKEVLLIIGSNAAGKTTLSQDYIDKGYLRVNRDTTGGTLESQVGIVENKLIEHGKIVVDNTYATIESRESMIAMAKKNKAKISCIWLKTSFEDAQINACLRMMETCNDILSPEMLKASKNPNLFPPAALFSYRNRFENTKKDQTHAGKQIPKLEHGFDEVKEVEFHRKWNDQYKNKALILDADDTIRKSNGKYKWPTSPDEVEVFDNVKRKIKEYKDAGFLILGVSNQSTHEKKETKTSLQEIDACFSRTNELLEVDIHWEYCPHYRFPISCYCRKPSVGLGVKLIYNFKLKPDECIFVGDSKSDKTFSERLNFKYQHPNEFFK